MPKYYKVINREMDGYGGIIRDDGPHPQGNRRGEYIKAGQDKRRRPIGYRTIFVPNDKSRYKEVVLLNAEEENAVQPTTETYNGAWIKVTYNAYTGNTF